MFTLLDCNVFLNPMGTKLYISIAHDSKVGDDLLDRFDGVLQTIQKKLICQRGRLVEPIKYVSMELAH